MPIVIAGIIVLILGVGGYVFYTQPTDDGQPTPAAAVETDAMQRNETDTVVTSEPEETTAAGEQADNAATELMFANGTYTSVGTYIDPGRTEHEVAVELTVENDIVTAADVLYNGKTASSPMHKNFAGGWEPLVIGQPLSDIDLSRVGGASLTSEAFNDAIADIKAEASA